MCTKLLTKNRRKKKQKERGPYRVAGIDLVPVVQVQVVALLLHDGRDVIPPEDPHSPATQQPHLHQDTGLDAKDVIPLQLSGLQGLLGGVGGAWPSQLDVLGSQVTLPNTPILTSRR